MWIELWSDGDYEGAWYIGKTGDSRTPYVAGSCDGDECFSSWEQAAAYVKREGRREVPEAEPQHA
jgi:hypothetical protein